MIRLALSDAVPLQPALAIFAVAVMLSAHLGGLRGGLAATVATCTAVACFLLPALIDIRIGSTAGRWQAVLLVLGGGIIAVLGETLHRARRRGKGAIDRQQSGAHALRRSEARYDALVDWSPDPIVIHRRGTTLFANPAAVAMFGALDQEALVGRHLSDLLRGDSLPLVMEPEGDLRSRTPSSRIMEMVALRLDGTEVGVEVQSRSIDADGGVAQMMSLRDISVRLAHEVEIDRLNRMYSALSEINQAIVRMPPREALFASVCRTLVDHGGVRAAWIDWDVGGTRKIAAAAGHEDNGNGDGRPGIDDVVGCREPAVTAFREGRSVLHNDMRSIEGPQAWKDLLERTGLRECAAFPVRENAVVRGTLTVATHESGFFQGKELALLEEISRDLSFALDIGMRESKRKEADVALVRERDRFRSLFDYAPVGIVITDPSGTFTEVNDTMQTMIGHSKAELVGHDASLIVALEEVCHIATAVTAIHTSNDYHREWRLRRQDGSHFHAEVRSIVMPDGNLLAIIRDVTERNDASEAVRVAEERMRFALESANVGIWDMDYVTGALAWSPTLEAQYGLRPGAFAGTINAFLDRVHPDDRRGVVTTLEKAVLSGLDFTVQNRAQWEDGTVRFLRGSGRVLLDAHGRPLRGIGISMDVTTQRSLEEQFRQSQKMEAVGRLAGGVAHDFNNLLTVILGYSELIVMDLGPGARQAHDLAEILRAGRSAAALTRQLLAFSRQQVIEPTAVDLTATMKEVAVMLERLIGADITIELALDPALGIITADHAQIEQLIMNLAVNARDAMPTGGTLTFATSNVSLDDEYATMHLGVQPGSYVRLTVTDTGSGMPPEVQAKLFEPFFTTKEVGKGTGLGLSTVHGIVARCRGSITVQSAPGVGTTFKIFFPIEEGAEVMARSVERPPEPVVIGRTVLIVDDSRSLRELTKRLAERLGYSVLIAEDAGMALRAVAEHPEIDIVLTDVVMPGWSGLELGRRILEQRPDIRMVLMSGYADEVLGQHDALDGGMPLLNKPFTSETLAQKLREALEPVAGHPMARQ